MFDFQKLKSLMDREGMTQEQLGDLIGVSRSMARWILSGKRSAKIEYLVIIAKHFNVTVDELLIA